MQWTCSGSTDLGQDAERVFQGVEALRERPLVLECLDHVVRDALIDAERGAEGVHLRCPHHQRTLSLRQTTSR